MPSGRQTPYVIDNALAGILMKLFTFLHISKLVDSYNLEDLQPRLRFFVEAATRRGINCKVLKTGDSYTEQLVMTCEGKEYHTEGIPTASHRDGPRAVRTLDKMGTKKILREGGFPTPEGRAYYFWQKERAITDAIASFGFPLVVKPLKGTFGRHVTTDIATEDGLRRAIQHAIKYQPGFVIERYVQSGSVHRITVVDFKFIACAQYTDIQVVGDGSSTVRTLIDMKNADPLRKTNKKTYPFFWPVLINDETDKLLREQSVGYDTVPDAERPIKLQQFPFLRWGADLIDRTDEMHPENRALVENVMRYFDMRVGGIDMIMEDVRRPWKEQACAILEINGLPCIDMHHVPSAGKSRNIADPLVDLFLKYYVSMPSSKMSA